MLRSLRFAVIAEADRYTHLLWLNGKLERLVKGELTHATVGIVGSALTSHQARTIDRLCFQARRDNPRVHIRK